MPGKKRVLKELEVIVTQSIELNVQAIVDSNLSFSVALDVATTKEMRNSYFGVIITYINANLEIKNFAVDVIELLDRHTGENLKREVLESLAKWNLNLKNASAIVTGEASNMAKAFE